MARERPVVIEAAINGVATHERNLNIPIGPEAIRNCARACYEAGAWRIHAHNPSSDAPSIHEHIDRLQGEGLLRLGLFDPASTHVGLPGSSPDPARAAQNRLSDRPAPAVRDEVWFSLRVSRHRIPPRRH